MQNILCTFLLVLLFGTACANPDLPTAPDETQLPVGPRARTGETVPSPDAWRSGDEIQAAIDLAEPGATIELDAAVYLVTREIAIRGPVTLKGQPGTTLVLAESGSTSVIALFGSLEAPVENVRLERLRIFGRGSAQRAGAGVALINVRNCQLVDLSISNCYLDGVYASGAIGCRFEDLTLQGNGRHGIAFGEASPTPSESNVLLRCRALANQLHGFDGEPVVNTRFEQCEAADNAEDGFSLGAGSRTRGNSIVDSESHHNGRFGFMVWSDANRIDRCSSIANAMAGFHVSGPAASDNVIRDCSAVANGWHGVSLDRTTRSLVASNRVEDNAQAMAGDGIALVASFPVHGNSVIDNRSSGRRQRFALVVTALAMDTILSGNVLEGPTSVADGAVAR